jgi:hypothetical protein
VLAEHHRVDAGLLCLDGDADERGQIAG